MRKTIQHKIITILAALLAVFTITTTAVADMQGVDVSNWQCGIDTYNLQADFVVVGTTWGVGGFNNNCLSWGVNQDANRVIAQAQASGKRWGIYHYAMGNNPESEAEFFYANTSNYWRNGVVALDFEPQDNAAWGNWDWARRFLRRCEELSGGVRPMLYTMGSAVNSIPQDLRDRYALWAADYADMNTTGYQSYPWHYGAYGESMLQYSGTGVVNVWNGIDLNVFRGDSGAWDRIANPDSTPTPAPSPSQPSQPDLEYLATRTIRGDFGNGQQRIDALGCLYDQVMAIVNQRLGGGGGVDLNALAWATIRGDYGNGQDRINALGGNYSAVMQIVNQILGA